MPKNHPCLVATNRPERARLREPHFRAETLQSNYQESAGTAVSGDYV